ncbi:hypothetical protein [Candidatus Nitrosacidococcus tergens]|nr:hypothetical protein [Candidatus Nitrosacidococcus tergens]
MTLTISASDIQAYHQFGNSVIVPAIYHAAQEIITTIKACQRRGARIKNYTQNIIGLIMKSYIFTPKE